MKRRLVIVLCVAVTVQVLSCPTVKNWRVYVRVGRGRIEGYPDGTMLAYFLAIREEDGAVPDSETAAQVSWEGINNPVRLVQGSVPLYAGLLYYTDLRASRQRKSPRRSNHQAGKRLKTDAITPATSRCSTTQC